jgi:autotransporter-associated beta strand protein
VTLYSIYRCRIIVAIPAIVLVAMLALGQPALAADATWSATPGSGDFNDPNNWNPTTVPDGTAIFDASANTNISIASSTTVGGLTIDAGSYSFHNTQPFELTGAGVTVNAGSATLTNDWTLTFSNTSTAGNATINDNLGNQLVFQDDASGATATITNDGLLEFHDNAAAGSANITSSFGVAFSKNATAGNATINIASGFLAFHSGTTAGTSTITNGGTLTFDDATAEDAVITTTSGGTVTFIFAATGGDAQFITQAGGTFDISDPFLFAAGVAVGSIEGAGDYVLGNRTLTVGSNDFSTEVSGVISGTNGSLTKVGAGTLTLSGTNTYTGATDVDDGTCA